MAAAVVGVVSLVDWTFWRMEAICSGDNPRRMLRRMASWAAVGWPAAVAVAAVSLALGDDIVGLGEAFL